MSLKDIYEIIFEQSNVCNETESILENPNVGTTRSLTGNRQRSSRFVLLSGSEADWLENSRATLIGLV